MNSNSISNNRTNTLHCYSTRTFWKFFIRILIVYVKWCIVCTYKCIGVEELETNLMSLVIFITLNIC